MNEANEWKTRFEDRTIQWHKATEEIAKKDAEIDGLRTSLASFKSLWSLERADRAEESAALRAEIAALRQRAEEQRREFAEREACKLALVSTVLMGDTAESLAANKTYHPDFHSAAGEDAFRAVEKIISLRQRAEDAELIAWGLARDGYKRPWITDHRGAWYVSTMESYRAFELIGSAGEPPVLTPEAREALRKAKESDNG